MVKNKAFTIAELLITISIIGIITEITLPPLITNVNKEIRYAQFQTANSIMTNLGMQIYREYDYNITDIYDNPQEAITAFAEKLQYLKICDSSNFQGNCWHKESTKSPDGVFNLTKTTPIISNQHVEDSIVLKNGMLLGIEQNFFNPSCDGSWVWNETTGESIFCGEMMIDVNGFKGPNVLGRDIFTYILTKNRFYPAGMDNQDTPVKGYCNADEDPESAGWENGKACTYRLILEREMNY